MDASLSQAIIKGGTMMNDPAKNLRTASAEQTHAQHTVTLRVIDHDTLSSWTQSSVAPSRSNNHCLLSLVALESPKIRSTLARRLRLKDSLAGGNASHNAGILAKDPHFWDYLQQISLTAYESEIDTRRARYFINRVCGIGGRYELERNTHLAQRFFALIEQPFLDWLFAGEGL
jgi:hypothetical protein